MDEVWGDERGEDALGTGWGWVVDPLREWVAVCVSMASTVSLSSALTPSQRV